MTDYTDEEIEMLARFIHDANPPTTLTFDRLVAGNVASMRRVVSTVLAPDSTDPIAPYARAAVALMRRAYERGATDMRQRAVDCVTEMSASFDDHRAFALECSSDAILKLPLS